VVRVGTVVRVLAISDSLIAMFDAHDRERLRSMLGQALAVYEVDEDGSAWVEQWWEEGEGAFSNHSLALASADMAVCAPGTVPDRAAV